MGEVAKVTMGQSPSSKNYTDNPNDYVLVQGNADLKSNEISPRVWTKEVTKQVHKGEFIMTVRAPVGYLATANMDAVIGRGVAAIDGNKYLYYLLQTKLLDKTWEKLSSGSTFESISSNDIKNLEIKVTETEEEKLIAKLMDTVTYFVTLQQRKLNQLKRLKRAMLQQLFADKNSKQPNLRFKNFKGDWEQHKLKSVVSVNSGKDYKSLEKGNIPVYGTGGYITSVSKSLSNQDAIGLGRKGTINKPYILKAPFWTVDTLFYLTLKPENILTFIYSLIQKINWLKYDESTGLPSLSKKNIENVLVSLTKLDEQQKIGKVIVKLDKFITLHQSKIEQLTILKKYLLQKLFI